MTVFKDHGKRQNLPTKERGLSGQPHHAFLANGLSASRIMSGSCVQADALYYGQLELTSALPRGPSRKVPEARHPCSAQLLRGDGAGVERRVLVIMLCKQDPDMGCH